MSVPRPFELLFGWIEARGLYLDTKGRRVGYLYSEDELRAGWTDAGRPGGTRIEFSAEGSADLKSWFGCDDPGVLSRVSVFAQTGSDGSMAAFWLDDSGRQQIVHLGSGSGSTLGCVLSSEPVGFLRLLAIGYDEICWDDQFAEPPNTDPARGLVVHPNAEFQTWLVETFSVGVPRTALEIVEHPAQIGDADSPDAFCQWCERIAT
jgi:hypothetical protein